MKNTFYTILILSVAGLSSCERVLEEEIRSQVPDSYMNTAIGFEAGVKACYFPLRNHYGSERSMTLTVWGTDTYTMGRGSSFKYYNQYTNQLDPRASYVTQEWNDAYIAINTCNAVIERSQQVTGLPEATIRTRVAEAKFLRAHYYFILVQMFGEVHLNLTETKGVVVDATRSPISDVYDVIVSDLESAIPDLPAVQAEYGRVTKPAAQHMLARVLLTRASSTAAKSDDYTRAAALAVSVIEDYNFSLLPDFAAVFDQNNERHSEVIWSVQFTKEPLTNGAGNTSHLYFLMEYDIIPGMKRDIKNGRPWIRYAPTRFTTDTLFADRVNDTRYEKTFQQVYYCNNPGTYTINGKQVTLQEGDTCIWLPGYELTPEEIAERNYHVITPSGYTQNRYLSLLKFQDPQRIDVNYTAGSRDFIVYRLAETYLIAAEAYLMSGRPDLALPYVNAVRVRAARVGNTPAETQAHQDAMKVTEADLDIDFILDELGRELLGEMKRWFDLVRTNKLVERVQKHNPEGSANVKPFHMRRPIPQDQIDRVRGNADAFPQNPGY